MTTLRSFDRDVEIQPLRQWPNGYERTTAAGRKGDPFHASFESTLQLLDHELEQNDAEGIVLQLEVPPDQIRKSDGLPYRNAKIDPGVVLTFENENGVQTYPCDTYREWEVNLRAIAKVLEYLRAIGRYGVGHGSEQYRGFTPLVANVDDRLGPEEAARIVVATAGHRSAPDFERRVEVVLDDEAEATAYLKAARKMSHPDRPGGTAAQFKRVGRAGEILRQYHTRAERKAAHV